MPSDVTFGVWLATLKPEVVIKDRESGFTDHEQSWLLYMRGPQQSPGTSR